MFDFSELRKRVVAAPMAGGPTVPALVTAAAAAGGVGFLAAGYKTPDALAREIDAVRAGTDVFGVNIFFPERRTTDREALARFRDRLAEFSNGLGALTPDIDGIGDDSDYFDAKVALMIDRRVPLVSFTFGCPSADVVDELHRAGCSVGVTVTSADDARTAAAAGADWLCVQGPEAGGHRSTFDRDLTPPTQPLDELLRDVRAAVDVPLVASGGIATKQRADEVRALGAVAVQVGTALLRTDEAATKPAHADALADSARTETVVTRAYSGRPARGLRNRFIDALDGDSAPEYPAVNTLTGPLRKANSADPDIINLWAGTAFREARVESAVQTIERLG